MKKILSSFIVSCLIFLCTGSVFAAEELQVSPNEPPIDYGEPISVETYFDEELNAFVTEKSYIVPVKSSTFQRSTDKTIWHKKEKDISTNGGQSTLTIFAEGQFTYDGTTVSVDPDSVSGGYSGLGPIADDISEDITYGFKNPIIGYDYAYVTYDFTYYSYGSTKHTYTVTAKVNRNGKPN